MCLHLSCVLFYPSVSVLAQRGVAYFVFGVHVGARTGTACQLANDYESQISCLYSKALNCWRHFRSQRARLCLRYRLFSLAAKPQQGIAPGVPTANNFLKGASFSPDGTCLLTSSDDTVLRVFEVPNRVLRGVRYSYSFTHQLSCRASGPGGDRPHEVGSPAKSIAHLYAQ